MPKVTLLSEHPDNNLMLVPNFNHLKRKIIIKSDTKKNWNRNRPKSFDFAPTLHL